MRAITPTVELTTHQVDPCIGTSPALGQVRSSWHVLSCVSLAFQRVVTLFFRVFVFLGFYVYAVPTTNPHVMGKLI